MCWKIEERRGKTGQSVFPPARRALKKCAVIGRHPREQMKHAFLLSLIVVISAAALHARELDSLAQQSILAFATLESSLPPLKWIRKQNGEGLAWKESHRLAAYLSMCEATGDTGYLNKAMPEIDEILKIRDDRMGRRDEIRDTILPAWCSTKYSKGKQHAWIVHAGMITYPVARWVYLVTADSTLNARYQTTADRYLHAVTETVQIFDTEWREGPANGEGYYQSAYTGKCLPYNQQNALGRTLVMLWLVTGNPHYREKAEKFGAFFKNRLRVLDGRYVWRYAADRLEIEDIMHAAINIDFAVVCFRSGMVFSLDDMTKFVGTLKWCSKENGSAAFSVDGKGEHTGSPWLTHWGHLAFFDLGIRPRLFRHLQNASTENYAIGLAGAAYLVETQYPLSSARQPLPRKK
jgi:hypothetical protein